MKCDEVQKEIYLFTELKEEERNQVLEHIRHCAACHELFESVENMNVLVKRAAHTRNEPDDSFRLTNRIMNDIKQINHQSTFLDKVFAYLEIKQVKWAMTMISFALISFLAIEHVSPTQNPESYTVSPSQVSQATILDMHTFKDELQKHRAAKKASLMTLCADPQNLRCIRQRLIRIKNF